MADLNRPIAAVGAAKTILAQRPSLLASRMGPTFLGVAGLILLSLPAWGGDFIVRLVTSIFVYAVMAEGLNIIAGYTGYPAFGQAVFFGLGGYFTGLTMNNLGVPFVVAFIVAGLLCGVYATIWGIPTLRLQGHYFAIATLGIAETTRVVIANTNWAGGPNGINLPIYNNYVFFYYALFALMVGSMLFVWWISRSRLGYGLMAIRENEEAARIMGIDTTMYKVLAFALSGIMTGFAGSLYAYWISFIDPYSVFDSSVTIQMIVMTTLGGAGTVVGPVLGAFILNGISNYLWEKLLFLHTAFLGLAIILIVMFLPKGVMDLISGRRRLGWRMFLENINQYRV